MCDILRHEKPWSVVGLVYGQSKGERSINVLIKDFENLQHKPGEYIMSRINGEDIDGRDWFVLVCPKGLANQGGEKATVMLGVNGVKNEFVVSFTIQLSSSLSYEINDAILSASKNSCGANFRRDHVLSKCLNDDGSLQISIKFCVHEEKDRCWYPERFQEDQFRGKGLLQNTDEADVVMSVGEEGKKYHLHKCVLGLRSPGLYQLVKEVPQGEELDMPEIKESIFKIIIDFIYDARLPTVEDDDAMELLDLANKFGCNLLKLQVESEITYKMVNPGNAADWLVIADGKICPLLKEACMDICKENFEEVKASPGWKRVRESSDLMEEVIEHLSTTTSDSSNHIDLDEADRMDVGTLRKMLQPYDIDMDGTKKMLIQRVKGIVERLRSNHTTPESK